MNNFKKVDIVTESTTITLDTEDIACRSLTTKGTKSRSDKTVTS